MSMYPLAAFFILTVVNINSLPAQNSSNKLVIQPVVKEKISSFPIADVQLLDGPFKEIKNKVHNSLLAWNADSLLHWHRKAAGLVPKADHYKGWESGGSNILGHYLSALAYMYATTGDKLLLDRLNYIVDELDACQKAAKDGAVFNGTNFREAFDKMRNGQFEYKIVGPEFPLVNDGNFFYGIHKNIAGLRDAYLMAGNKKASAILIAYVDWIDGFVAAVPEKEFQKILDVEHGGMTEVIADVYAMTGDKKYAALAEKFVHKRLSVPLAEGKDILYPHHANAKIPQFVGYAHLYKLVGAEAEQEGRAAFNFYDIVLKNHTLSNGGNSEYERFGPPGQISKRIGMSSSETCNTYNMLKLSNELYSITGDKKYFDYYERAMYNHLLASVNENGTYCYYVSMKPGWFKTFSTPFDANWCCVGSGMENPGKYEERIYAHDESNVYVNLFIPSKLDWKERKFGLSQEGRFPETDTVTIRITHAGKATGVKVRKPSWIAGDVKIWLNNAVYPVHHDSGYIRISNKLKKGDIIKIKFLMSVRIEETPDNPSIASVFYGPVLLAGQLGKKGIENKSFMADDAWGLTKYPEIKNIPVLLIDQSGLNNWMEPQKGQPLTFRANIENGKSLTFKPFYKFTDERYSVYWDVFSPAGWAAYNDSKNANIKDEVKTGDSLNEAAHQLRSEKTVLGNTHFKHFRSAADDGWFSYDVKTLRTEPLFLLVKYWGGGWGTEPRGSLNIYVNNVKIASKDLGDKAQPTVFYEVSYEIPATLIKGHATSTVRVEAASAKMEGGVYGIKVVTTNGLALRELLKDQ